MSLNSQPHLIEWWRDNPSDPDRPSLNNPDVQRLIAEIAPESHSADLGGVMSLNVKLDSEGVVLRVHQPFVSRQRLLAVQQVRLRLSEKGLIVAVPLRWRNASVFRCGSRWAELEKYLAHHRLKQKYDSYVWLFGAMGVLHRELATLDIAVPRPLLATYAPPGSLRRWLPVTEAAVQGNSEAADIVQLLRRSIRRLRLQWVPASQLPQQFVHGDVRLSNVCQTSEGETLYLDFGFLAQRPRIFDLAYSLAFMVRALHGNQALESFAWRSIPPLIEAYEASANSPLTATEKKALVPYTASVPLHAAALDGFTDNPAGHLQDRLPFMRLSDWLLAHPDAMLS